MQNGDHIEFTPSQTAKFLTFKKGFKPNISCLLSNSQSLDSVKANSGCPDSVKTNSGCPDNVKTNSGCPRY